MTKLQDNSQNSFQNDFQDKFHKNNSTDQSVWAVFLVFLKLGLTSFGGPVAHLGYFREEFVARRRWLSEAYYAEIVALCQFLPGPASSQVGIAIGLTRAGYLGALAAWLGFTLPSAAVLALFAFGVATHADLLGVGVLHGLKLASVAVVAQAVWGMSRQLCTTVQTLSLAVLSACALLLMPVAWLQFVVIGLGAVLGMAFLRPVMTQTHETMTAPVSRSAGAVWLMIFAALLVLLPMLVQAFDVSLLAMFDSFYRTGAFVFGGGHVVLPLLQSEVVGAGLVDNSTFLAGYGATQAVPGPLFTFASFLGAAVSGVTGAVVATVAIFLSSFLLVFGALPFWQTIRHHARVRAALMGVNACVVGILLAALYQPIWTSAVATAADFAVVIVAMTALMAWRVPPWAVVVLCGVVGALW